MNLRYITANKTTKWFLYLIAHVANIAVRTSLGEDGRATFGGGSDVGTGRGVAPNGVAFFSARWR
jgi:hypothetical protein